MKALAERLSDRAVRSASGCLLWNGSLRRGGYGVMITGSRSDGSRQSKLVHRVAWEVVNGSIPDGLDVLHRCDVPNCIKVFACSYCIRSRDACSVCEGHLFLGTHRDNNLDRHLKGRTASGNVSGRRRKPENFVTNRPRGDSHGNRKLDGLDVLEIRRRAASGESRASLQAAFDMSKTQIARIIRCEHWKENYEGEVRTTTTGNS